jgi:DNA topoisomerase-6 subunit B
MAKKPRTRETSAGRKKKVKRKKAARAKKTRAAKGTRRGGSTGRGKAGGRRGSGVRKKPASRAKAASPRKGSGAKKKGKTTGAKAPSKNGSRKRGSGRTAGSGAATPKRGKAGSATAGRAKTAVATPRGKRRSRSSGPGSAVERARSGQGSLFEPAPPQTPSSARAASEAAPAPAPSRRRGRASTPATARTLAARQREISISEFFTKNRHLLGFDSPSKALLTTIKEGVDNSLDACEEAHILPEVRVEIRRVGEERYRVAVQDNGPGIVRSQIPRIFGKLLYGSKFHTLRQGRGQQGIGISAAGMYGQLTTGLPVTILSRTSPRRPAHHFEVSIDTKRNEPVVTRDEVVNGKIEQGTRVEIELTGSYKRGRHSVDAYLRQTAIANPHVQLSYVPPDGAAVEFPRVSRELPKPTHEIRPHPHGVELGMLLHMLQDTRSRNLRGFLTSEFSRVSPRVADEILERAQLPPRFSPKRARRGEAERLLHAVARVKITKPPTDCLSPIGEKALVEGLEQRLAPDFATAVTRSPAVYRGNPFQVEVALAYGGGMSADDLAVLHRFANRVPLQYQRSACAVTRAVLSTSWKSYGLQQSRGALPTGPLTIVAHLASVWVPFTSESKEAIAHYPEIIKEFRLGLQECGRRLGAFIRRGVRMRNEERKRSYIETYLPHIGIALREIIGISEKEEEKLVGVLKDVLEKSRKM